MQKEPPTTWRARVYAFLEGYNKNELFSLSWWYWRTNFVLTIAHCIAYALESNPAFLSRPLPDSLFIQIRAIIIFQTVITAPQTADFFVRLITAPSWWRHLLQPMRFVELIFFAAFYAHVGILFTTASVSDVRVENFWLLHILSAFRLVGVLRLFRYFKTMSLIFMALRRKWFAFTLFVGVVVVCAFFFGAGMYYTEKAGETYDNLRKLWIRDVDGSVSPFQSIYGSMWWGLVTFTTVGYGDTFPVTDGGKVVASCAAIFGVMLVAMPIGIFSQAFSEIWGEYEKHKRQQWRTEMTAWKFKRSSKRLTRPNAASDQDSESKRLLIDDEEIRASRASFDAMHPHALAFRKRSSSPGRAQTFHGGSSSSSSSVNIGSIQDDVELHSAASDAESDFEGSYSSSQQSQTRPTQSIVAPHKKKQVRKMFDEIKKQQKALQALISKLDDVLEGYEEPDDLSDAEVLN